MRLSYLCRGVDITSSSHCIMSMFFGARDCAVIIWKGENLEHSATQRGANRGRMKIFSIFYATYRSMMKAEYAADAALFLRGHVARWGELEEPGSAWWWWWRGREAEKAPFTGRKTLRSMLRRWYIFLFLSSRSVRFYSIAAKRRNKPAAQFPTCWSECWGKIACCVTFSYTKLLWVNLWCEVPRLAKDLRVCWMLNERVRGLQKKSTLECSMIQVQGPAQMPRLLPVAGLRFKFFHEAVTSAKSCNMLSSDTKCCHGTADSLKSLKLLTLQPSQQLLRSS